MKLWTGRFQKEISKTTNDFNSSIPFDQRMYKEDIEGSIAHAAMLGQCGIIEKSEAEKICEGLSGILKDIESGTLAIDPQAEDIHTFIEGELTARLGDTGKRLHTAAPLPKTCLNRPQRYVRLCNNGWPIEQRTRKRARSAAGQIIQ